MSPKSITPPNISITVNGKTAVFNNFYRAYGYIHQFIRADEETSNDIRVKEIEDRGVKYVYEAKFILEHKYNLWVATSKEGKFNIRKDGRPYHFGPDKMFGLNGKELISFYQRYTKTLLLE